MDCLQHIVIIYYRLYILLYFSAVFVCSFIFCCCFVFLFVCLFSSMQLNVLNWNFQLNFPCVGKSWNLRLVLLVLVELFGVCPAYEYFTAQPEIWVEFLQLSLFWFSSFWDFSSFSSHCDCPEICLLYQNSETAGFHQHGDGRDLPLD